MGAQGTQTPSFLLLGRPGVSQVPHVLTKDWLGPGDQGEVGWALGQAALVSSVSKSPDFLGSDPSLSSQTTGLGASV